MSLRPPGSFALLHSLATGADSIDAEILAEKAAALGRSGEAAAKALAAYRAAAGEARTALAYAAAEAVLALFIQRELTGMRSHADVIRQLDIPSAVLGKIGAKPPAPD
ncbi:DUF6665 family protein [Methylopila sp. M107]|uniref:DUF6665 family protein n=1 Tax=Methylopila sp. M107 TaxID=1101190 RepID=UPI0004784387|nr:DUF6665 family protein [Methylopila sp. M107]